MFYSVYEPDSKRYFHYAAKDPFFVRSTDEYVNAQFVPWQEVQLVLPNDAAPVGSGEEPKGIICHPEQLRKPVCKDEVDILWFLGGFLVKWLFFSKDWSS